MRRPTLIALLTVAALLAALPVPSAPARTPRIHEADPLGRAEAWLPQDPGTKKWLELDYGPYEIHPGSDFSRIDAEVVGADGFAVGFVPSVVYADGTEASSHDIHIHHAHWTWLDPDAPGYHRWFYGTGEERTQGSINPSAMADPRYADGLRYGIALHKSDHLGFISMLHNKTAEALTVYLRVRIEFVYGTYDEIKKAEGLDYHNLTPVLLGSTFNVPHTGGEFVYPLDTTKKTIGPHSNYANPVESAEVVPGVGQVWTVPWNGTIVIGAGHSHPGAREVALSNLGTKTDPCPDDGDRYPGVTLARSRNITRGGVFPSAEYQMGLTQPGWRVHVRKGDRLAINALYDATNYAYPDAMSYFGMYIDPRDKTTDDEACTVELLNDPNATRDEIAWTVPNQQWPEHHPMATCTRCDVPGPLPKPGPATNVVHIAGFQYLPGNLGYEGEPLGPPVVQKGETLTFINEDYAEASVRHSVTTCKAPCNGPTTMNYPFHDGVIHSGALGYMWEETYINARPEPYYQLDTSDLAKGYYSYFCQLHAWMRGGFYVK
jgi:plastocyanin